ncbi:unnamed protein product [Boreogadus saida]
MHGVGLQRCLARAEGFAPMAWYLPALIMFLLHLNPTENSTSPHQRPSVCNHAIRIPARNSPLATAHLGEVCRGQSTDANEMTCEDTQHDSIQSRLDTTLSEDALIALRRDDVCMKEQSCPGHGLREQCDHGPAGGVGRGGIVLNLPAARNRPTALVPAEVQKLRAPQKAPAADLRPAQHDVVRRFNR